MDDEVSKLISLLRRKKMPTYSDQQVVSAFNACLDLDKWQALPHSVKSRFKELLRCNRVKMVCFSDALGMGLRVYTDMTGMTINVNSDEAELVLTGDNDGRVDLDGHWVRCPPKPLEESENEQKVWIVANARGVSYVGERSVYSPDDDDDVDEDEDRTYPHPMWRPTRGGAKKMTKAEAEKWAAAVKGVVLHY